MVTIDFINTLQGRNIIPLTKNSTPLTSNRKKIPFEVIGSSPNLLVTVEKSKDPKLLLVFREMKLAGCRFKIDDH